ncbi:MAG TPA: GAF domain-containing protein [Aggregatilineales bacterium]|nr:GAF domain-containing protein [Aggregatilineales bacterium]
MDTSAINVLVAVRLPSIARYRENLSRDSKLKVTAVSSEAQAREVLAHPEKRSDVFVIDNGLGNVFELVRELRQTYPRLIIVLVDEDADFGMPGRADDVSTEPFKEEELIKKIKRLAEERSLETLRADALPPVRSFAKSLRKATKGLGKQQAAVEAVKELGYDYVAFYSVATTEPPSLTLGAQVGPNGVTAIIPVRTDYNNLLGWVAQNGQSRIVGPGDEPNHLLIEKGRYAAAACVPVGSTLRFGVLLACREQTGSITQQNVLMLELVSAQLASALAKEQRG